MCSRQLKLEMVKRLHSLKKKHVCTIFIRIAELVSNVFQHLPLYTLPKHPSPISLIKCKFSLRRTGTVTLVQAEYCGLGA